VDNQVEVPSSNHPNIEIPNKKKGKEIPKESTKKEDKVVVDTQEKSFVPKTPFPQRLQANRKKNHFERILKVFKNVQINTSVPRKAPFSVRIGNQVMDQCRLDLEASVNLLPYFVYK